jgi:transposase
LEAGLGERIGLSDEKWALIGPLLPSETGRGCRPAGDNRPLFEGLMWIARTGAQWRHLPEAYGKWNSVFRRYRRWATIGVFEAMLETLAEAVERCQRRHDRQHHRPGAPLCGRHEKRAQQAEALGRSRGGFTTKLHARCDAGGRPFAFVLTPGQAHDTQGFGPLMRMIADRIDALLEYRTRRRIR